MSPASQPLALNKRDLPSVDRLPAGSHLLQDSDTSSIRYSGTFNQSKDDSCSGGTCTRLQDANAFLEFSFNGTDVWMFGKRGGIARIFVDDALIDVIDSSLWPSNSSALWAANNLDRRTHKLKVAGIPTTGLNLVIDLFAVNGDIIPLPDSSYIPAQTLTGIIVGSLVGFFALVAIVGITIFFCLRRRKQKRISKSGIKLIPPPNSADVKKRSFFPLNVFAPKETSTMDGNTNSYGGETAYGSGRDRPSYSTEATNPFRSPPFTATNTLRTASSASPPSSADASVPLFALPASPPYPTQRSGPAQPTGPSPYSIPDPSMIGRPIIPATGVPAWATPSQSTAVLETRRSNDESIPLMDAPPGYTRGRESDQNVTRGHFPNDDRLKSQFEHSAASQQTTFDTSRPSDGRQTRTTSYNITGTNTGSFLPSATSSIFPPNPKGADILSPPPPSFMTLDEEDQEPSRVSRQISSASRDLPRPPPRVDPNPNQRQGRTLGAPNINIRVMEREEPESPIDPAVRRVWQ